jgi:hypothetical protein
MVDILLRLAGFVRVAGQWMCHWDSWRWIWASSKVRSMSRSILFQRRSAKAVSSITNTDSSYVCQNGMVYLLGNSQDQWSISNATALANGLNKLWEDW